MMFRPDERQLRDHLGMAPGQGGCGSQQIGAPAAAAQPAEAASSGEVRYATFLANKVQDGRAFGGRVTVTSKRMAFAPVGASQVRGGTIWELGLAQVDGADVAPRGLNVHNGSLRRRLRVRTHAGEVEYFVVWRPRRKAALINRARSGE